MAVLCTSSLQSQQSSRSFCFHLPIASHEPKVEQATPLSSVSLDGRFSSCDSCRLRSDLQLYRMSSWCSARTGSMAPANEAYLSDIVLGSRTRSSSATQG